MGNSAVVERPESTRESRPPSKREQALREAIERVYRRYGTNLAAFYRDAHREAQRESEKKAR
jgi:hypothetical protein